MDMCSAIIFEFYGYTCTCRALFAKKCECPTMQKNIASLKIGVPAPKLGVINCITAVSA